MHRRIVIVFATAAFAAASYTSFSCSESTDGVMPVAAGATTPDGGTTETGSPTSSEAGAKTDAAVITASPVLLNEISPSDEWVELVSSGATAIDVSGFRVSDSEKEGGAPKLSDSVKLPNGTILSPKAYLIVQGGGLDGGGRPCPDGGQSYCFNAQFGISNKSGETLYLLDPSGAVVGSAVYPPKAVDAGDSWGRLPSGDPSGTFGATVPTPGAANQAK